MDSPYIQQTFDYLVDTLLPRKQDYVDFYLIVADAFAHANKLQEALQLYSFIVSLPSLVDTTTVCYFLFIFTSLNTRYGLKLRDVNYF